MQSHETCQHDVLNWPLRRGGVSASAPGPFPWVDQPPLSLDQVLRVPEQGVAAGRPGPALL